MRLCNLLLVGSLLGLACNRQPPPEASRPSPPDGLAPAGQPSGPAAQPSEAPSLSAGAQTPPHPATCEVEIFGQIKVPPSIKARGHLVVHVSNEDCTRPGAVMLGSAPAVDGRIAIEVFPRWGSDITICGALEEAPDRPVRFYGKAAGRFHAEAPGEVVFRGVVVELKKGPPLRLPVVYNPPQ